MANYGAGNPRRQLVRRVVAPAAVPSVVKVFLTRCCRLPLRDKEIDCMSRYTVLHSQISNPHGSRCRWVVIAMSLVCNGALHRYAAVSFVYSSRLLSRHCAGSGAGLLAVVQ